MFLGEFIVRYNLHYKAHFRGLYRDKEEVFKIQIASIITFWKGKKSNS